MSPQRRIRFGLKTLLVAVTLLCVVLALIAQPLLEARRQQQLLDQLAALGGRVSIRGTVSREPSLGRFVLALFDASYDRFSLYGWDFSGMKLRDDDLELVAQLKHVQELNVSNTQISDEGLRHLTDMSLLCRLDLAGTDITDQGLTRLRPLRNLTSLRVVNTASTYEALEQLDAELPYANFSEERAIEELKASGVQVIDIPRHGIVELARGVDIVNTSHEAVDVIVGMNRPATLSPADVSRLSYFKSLRSMTFHTVKLGPDGISTLKPLPALKDLDIWFTNLTDQDLAIIARHENLERLTIYDADGITDAGLLHLKALTKLRRLRVSACDGISQEGISALGRALSDCKFDYSKY